MTVKKRGETKCRFSFQLTNPIGHYEHNDLCLTECPPQTFVLNSYCLNECPENYTYVGDANSNGSGRCVPCIEVSKDGKCPTTCFGLKHSKWSDQIQSKFGKSLDEIKTFSASWEDTVNSKTIQLFAGCEVVVGSLMFLSHVFADPVHNIPEDHGIEPIPKNNMTFLEPLKSIKRIMGFLAIQTWPFPDFSVFENLETIDGSHALHKPGDRLGPDYVALFVSVGDLNDKNPARITNNLGFNSLNTISNGDVILIELGNACPLKTISWKTIIKNPTLANKQYPNRYEDGVFIGAGASSVSYVRKSPECRNFTCHEECDNLGCWGSSPSSCIKCKHYSYDGECLARKDLKLYKIENTIVIAI
mgnify:CR=1 FL=1